MLQGFDVSAVQAEPLASIDVIFDQRQTRIGYDMRSLDVPRLSIRVEPSRLLCRKLGAVSFTPQLETRSSIFWTSEAKWRRFCQTKLRVGRYSARPARSTSESSMVFRPSLIVVCLIPCTMLAVVYVVHFGIQNRHEKRNSYVGEACYLLYAKALCAASWTGAVRISISVE